MGPRRWLTRAGVAGAGLASGVAGWTAVNRAAVHRLARRPDAVDPADLELPPDVEERLLSVSDGWSLRVLLRGPAHGRPVVLLHGITLSAAIWPYQFADLPEAGLRVVALDLRGHGGSGGPPAADALPSRPAAVAAEGTGRTAPRLTLDRMALDVAEVLDQLDLDDVVLVGHSMGGMVALQLLAERPDLAAGHGRLSALGLVATTAHASRRRGLPGLSGVVAAAQPLISSAAGLAARLPGPTLPANDLAFLLARITFGEESSPGQVLFTGEMTSHVPVRVSAELLLQIFRFDADDVLPTIRLPSAVIVGDHDLMTPRSQSEHLAARIPGATLEVLPGCGHQVMLERPRELNKALLELAGRRQ